MGEVVRRLRDAVLGPAAELTDGQLLESYVGRREEAALGLLVRRHGPMVWGVCRRFLRDHHDAEDAFQATFVVLVRRAASIRPRERVASWLYGVARQTARKARATAARRVQRERPVAELPEPAPTRPKASDEVRPDLDEALSRLPSRYRLPLLLCELEGKTRIEAARQLGWPEGTVASRLGRGKDLLARLLSRRGLVLAAALAECTVSAGVPPTLLATTIKGAAGVAAGPPTAAGALTPGAAALAKGVITSMSRTKRLTALAALLLAAAVVLTPFLLRPAAGQAPSGDLVQQLQKDQLDKTGKAGAPFVKVGTRYTVELSNNKSWPAASVIVLVEERSGDNWVKVAFQTTADGPPIHSWLNLDHVLAMYPVGKDAPKGGGGAAK